ncbi:DsbA family protein [Gryllotalpicola ginsengisoli]|uniref:DsbA family protein n=1 Tax=Gryllotalpicola ginsengisoli TaxID=444608 RepID=UPI0003B5D7C6|nr:thioredoxin domain-containing protein [Gryllotalpicola ginsengisoli]
MTNGSARPTKKERQNAAREHARQLREEAKKKARRRRIFTQVGVGTGILVVLVVAAIVIVQIAKPASTAGPKNMASDGIVLTSTTKAVSTPAIPNGGKPTPTKQDNDDGKAHILLYEDLQCPACQSFEETNDDQIASWLDAGTATIEIHPIAILDRMSGGNRYSSRAANAVACVAQYEPSKFWAVNKAFYDDQPEENTGGATDKEIIAKIKAGGVSSSKVTACVKSEKFKGWVTEATDRITPVGTKFPNSSVKVASTGFATPTVLVNGKKYTGSITDAAAFKSFVESVAKGTTSATATPTPSASSAG